MSSPTSSSFYLTSVYHPFCLPATSPMSSYAMEGISQARIAQTPVHRVSEADMGDLPALLHSLKYCLTRYGAVTIVPPSTCKTPPMWTNPASYVEPSVNSLPYRLFPKDVHESGNHMSKEKGSVARNICKRCVTTTTCHGMKDADRKFNSALIYGK